MKKAKRAKSTKKDDEKHYYVDPVEFKGQLKEYYDSDVMTEVLGENLKKIAYGLETADSSVYDASQITARRMNKAQSGDFLNRTQNITT